MNNQSPTPDELNAVLYFLYYIYDVDDAETYQKLQSHIYNSYNADRIKNFKQAVDWALDTQDFMFEKQLPNLNKSNNEIKKYFQHLKLILDKIVAGKLD